MRAHVLATIAFGLMVQGAALAQGPVFPTTGEGLYEVGCAKCHGDDGRGVDLSLVAFDIPLPDFADCSFAAREPDADWITVSHEGGPVRGFSRTMPAFGGAFSVERLQLIMDHLRTFCTDKRWPRGELNLPRALVTEKAFPEDEAIYTLSVNSSVEGAVLNKITYEKRFGPRSMWEVIVPFGARELSSEDGWGNVGIGDVTLAVKHTVHHSVESGSIVAVGTEVILPTGSREDRLGTGTTRFEPFVAYGQLLSDNLFLQAFGGVQLSTNRNKSPHVVIARAVFGGTWTQGDFGRSWSPMVELLNTVTLGDNGKTNWSVVPQVQMSLNQRQHILLNVGVRLPLNDSDQRSSQVVMYVLWDWFDGGLFDGW